MSPLHLIALLLALHVALSDLHARRVSNRALLAALSAGAIAMCTPWSGMPASTAALSALLGLAVLLPFYRLGWMGAGDVKFFATLGFLLGWPSLLPIWIVASLLAGAHAVAVLATRRNEAWAPARAFQRRGWLPAQAVRAGTRMASRDRTGAPYATFLAIGAVVLLLAPEVFRHG
ncbi:prepilin peptidase [Pseudoxanthomonas broegbernensis]|uniref:Prepilin peptidase n=1 Tax=Pseudoxanthomonas broegbernensis TaxID=83619 RepID=A0A7V8GKW7_9GAMM|nr:prepilin peptidase [Pseudoxanthomonas broegbernensis]KAF1685437.1 prepilin peptidase [Pseudoxanthomonas broegbernensis]MBB6064432.1 prepilin peptidase CpaA [Pseudoxanthomonas broegbernensis]